MNKVFALFSVRFLLFCSIFFPVACDNGDETSDSDNPFEVALRDVYNGYVFVDDNEFGNTFSATISLGSISLRNVPADYVIEAVEGDAASIFTELGTLNYYSIFYPEFAEDGSGDILMEFECEDIHLQLANGDTVHFVVEPSVGYYDAASGVLMFDLAFNRMLRIKKNEEDPVCGFLPFVLEFRLEKVVHPK